MTEGLDNDAFRRVVQATNGGGSEEVSYAPRSAKSSAAAMQKAVSQGFAYSSVILFGIGMFALVMVVFIISREGGNRAGYTMPGDNCTVITCPAGERGEQGPPGQAGPPGGVGPSGPSGASGPQGNNGLPGERGPMGECSNSNPFCLQGIQGIQGERGLPGPTGLAGLVGPTGSQGSIGPRGFSGETGPSGPPGAIGDTGPRGIPGTCDCFTPMAMATIGVLNVTTSLTLSGSMTCPGGALDASCFGLTGACPDYSTCYLTSLGLNLNSSTPLVVPRLQVGLGPLDNGLAIVNLGQFPTNPVNRFTLYAKTQLDIASINTTLNINSFLANTVIQSSGGAGVSTTITSSGSAIVSGTSGVNIVASLGTAAISGGSANMQFVQSTSSITAQSTNFTLTTADMNVFKSGGVLPWFQTKSTTSLTCAASGPFASVASSSMSFPTDVIFGGTLLTSASSGLIKTAGLELCGTLIKTTGATLQLQDGTATKLVDIHGTITNSEGGFGVTFIDATGGVNFQDTAIHNSNGVAGPLVCDDAEGFAVTPNGTVYAESYQANTPGTLLSFNTASGGGDVSISAIGKTTTINGVLAVSSATATFAGNVIVTGSITAASVNSGAGSCCTPSDARAKKNVTDVTPLEDLELVLAMPRRVAFQYTDAYQKVDPSVDDNVQHGFIAQELEKILPRTVRLVNQTISGEAYTDFRRLMLDRIVPHVVGAVKQLHAEQVALRDEVAALRELIKHLINQRST